MIGVLRMGWVGIDDGGDKVEGVWRDRILYGDFLCGWERLLAGSNSIDAAVISSW